MQGVEVTLTVRHEETANSESTPNNKPHCGGIYKFANIELNLPGRW